MHQNTYLHQLWVNSYEYMSTCLWHQIRPAWNTIILEGWCSQFSWGIMCCFCSRSFNYCSYLQAKETEASRIFRKL